MLDSSSDFRCPVISTWRWPSSARIWRNLAEQRAGCAHCTLPALQLSSWSICDHFVSRPTSTSVCVQAHRSALITYLSLIFPFIPFCGGQNRTCLQVHTPAGARKSASTRGYGISTQDMVCRADSFSSDSSLCKHSV